MSKERFDRIVSALGTPFYLDDRCAVYAGDCLGLLPLTDPADLDWLVADPPYGIDYRSGMDSPYGMARSIEGDKDTSVRDFVLDWWGDRPALVFGTWRIPRPKATHTLLVWDTKGANGMGDLSVPWKPSHQEIYVLGKGFRGRRDTDVLRYAPVQSTAKNGRVHPHEKPVSLMKDLLRKCPSGIVLDPTCGSGPTLKAAKSLGLYSIGIEKDAKYPPIAAQRLRQGVLGLSELEEAESV